MAKWHLESERCQIHYWWGVTTQICAVVMTGWSKFTINNQRDCLGQGSDTLPVWNFCAGSSDVISQGNFWSHHKMLAVVSGQYKILLTLKNNLLLSFNIFREENWGFLKDYDLKGRFKPPKELPDKVSVFSDKVPNTTSRQFGHRVKSAPARTMQKFERLTNYRVKTNKELLCYD